MAEKTNCTIRGVKKYRLTKVIGKRINENGKLVPVRKTVYGKNKKDAERLLKEHLERDPLNNGRKDLIFGIVADSWIEKFFLPDPALKDRTKETYLGRWNMYVRPSNLYYLPLEKVAASTIQTFYNELDAPYSAVKTINKMLKHYYKFLEFEGFARDITGILTVPRKDTEKTLPSEPEVWTDEEIEIIMTNFDKADSRFRLKLLIILAYNTGCRISELLAIKYSDICNNVLTVSRQLAKRPIFEDRKKIGTVIDIETLKTTASIRRIPLNSAVIIALQEHQKFQAREMRKNHYETEFLFTTDTGALVDLCNADKAARRYYRRIGVPERGFHSYRHTFGTNLCRLNVPIQIASTLLGHSDISTTMQYYINVPQEDRRGAVELLANGNIPGLIKEPTQLYLTGSSETA